MRMKTIWLDCENYNVIATKEELDDLRKELIQQYMEDCKVDREEAESAIDCYIKYNIPAFEINLNESSVFWIDWYNQEIFTDEEIWESARANYPFDEWINDTYSPFDLFVDIQENDMGYIYDQYDENVKCDYIENNGLEDFCFDDEDE